MVEVGLVPNYLISTSGFCLFSPYIFIVCCMSGSFGGSDVGGMYSSSYGGDYISRGSDVMFLAFFNRQCYMSVCLCYILNHYCSCAGWWQLVFDYVSWQGYGWW